MVTPSTTNDFRAFYLNNPHVLPDRFVQKELMIFFMGGLTLIHAIRFKKTLLWVGFLIYGLLLETIGYVTATHYHGQFIIQVFHFLPLKEMVFYTLILYPAWAAVEQVGLQDAWSSCVLMAFVTVLANMPYDAFAVRAGFGWCRFEPSFSMANFDPSSWHGGVAAVYYGWIGMGGGAGMAAYLSQGTSAVHTIMMFVLGVLLSCAFWTPFHTMKAVGCVASGGNLLAAGSLTEAYAQYLSCIRTSPCTDDICWLAALCALLALVCTVPLKKQRCISRSVAPQWHTILLVVMYHTFIVWQYFCYDAKSPYGSACLWASYGLVGSSVHVLLHRCGRQRRKME